MYLCIDTTTLEAGITLIGDGLYHIKLDPQNVSEDILGKIDEIIQKANIKLEDIKGVFVIKGPGSFTGLRVGIAVANQFAHQLKIPIIGLRTDEWWRNRTDEKDFMYLQSMNKAEVYMVGPDKKPTLCHPEELACPERSRGKGSTKWLGQITDNHRQKLPSDFKEITDLRTVEETWELVTRNLKLVTQNKYELIEPYYGKEPTITKSKRKLSI